MTFKVTEGVCDRFRDAVTLKALKTVAFRILSSVVRSLSEKQYGGDVSSLSTV